MLTSIELENYRGFRAYRVGSLARVNLLVGKNNSGKTSILEALHFLASGGDPSVLAATAWRRGEAVFVPEDREVHRRRAYPSMVHFFHGHDLELGNCFQIRAREPQLRISGRIIKRAELGQQRLPFDEGAELRPGLALLLEGPSEQTSPRGFPLTDEGALPLERLSPYGRSNGTRREDVPPVEFIAPAALEPRSVGEMWDTVVLNSRESEVIHALRLLEPRLSDVVFLSGAASFRYGSSAGILVGLEGSRRRVPLGSLGDGMSRLLVLCVSLIQSAGGVLLVDEIDTGLHHLVMGQIWRLILTAADQYDVQVFATTHSEDCLRGLAWLCANYPELGAEVSLQKIEPSLEQSVALDAESIKITAAQEIEVR